MKYRIGSGYDLHPLISGNKLNLGGIEIPAPYSIEAYSDGDVLCHAICDALLGSMALGDLGKHFPSGQSEWKDVAGIELIQRCLAILSEKSLFNICNIDSTIILQSPKLQDFIPSMREQVSDALNLPIENVSIKATTTDHLGIIGQEKAIAASCVVLIEIA